MHVSAYADPYTWSQISISINLCAGMPGRICRIVAPLSCAVHLAGLRDFELPAAAVEVTKY